MDDSAGRKIEIELPADEAGGDEAEAPMQEAREQPGASPEQSAPDMAIEGAPDAVAELQAEVERLQAAVAELQAEVERLQAAVAEEHDRHLRAVAELQNYRRRVMREQQESARYAGRDVLSRMLPVMDNLQRVLEHEADAGSEEFVRGVRLVVDEFFRVLGQVGVSVIDCEGEQFDPSLHEAVAQVDTQEAPEGTVVAVDTPGYCLHDRCLRPARVVVARRPEGPESAS